MKLFEKKIAIKALNLLETICWLNPQSREYILASKNIILSSSTVRIMALTELFELFIEKNLSAALFERNTLQKLLIHTSLPALLNIMKTNSYISTDRLVGLIDTQNPHQYMDNILIRRTETSDPDVVFNHPTTMGIKQPVQNAEEGADKKRKHIRFFDVDEVEEEAPVKFKQRHRKGK